MIQIPKVMNFFWAKGSMSWLRFLTLQSFRTLNPDWSIRLFQCEATQAKSWLTPETQDYDCYKGPDYAERIKELDIEIVEWTPFTSKNLAPAHACDIFQWWLLSNEGGFYSDMDILYVKPIQYEEWRDTDILYCLSQGYMSIGFIASSPKNPVFVDLLKLVESSYNGSRYQNTGVEAIQRFAKELDPKYVSTRYPGVSAMSVIESHYPKLRYAQLEDNVVYPWPWNKLENIWNKTNFLSNSTVGIHWFGGDPSSQIMNARLTPTNLKKFPCTFTRYVTELGLVCSQ